MSASHGEQAGKKQDEVVVVGASAAGLYAAKELARGGKAVRVVESKAHFEPAPRRLIVTDHFRKQLGPSAKAASSTKFGALNCSQMAAPLRSRFLSRT